MGVRNRVHGVGIDLINGEFSAIRKIKWKKKRVHTNKNNNKNQQENHTIF